MQKNQVFFGVPFMFVATCLIARFGLQEKFEFFNRKRVHSIGNCMEARVTFPYLIMRGVSSSCTLRQFCIYFFFSFFFFFFFGLGRGSFLDQTVILIEIGVCS